MDRASANKGALMSANGGILNINPSKFKDLKQLKDIHLGATERFKEITLRNIDIIKKKYRVYKGYSS